MTMPGSDQHGWQALGLLVGTALSAECTLRLNLRSAVRQLNRLGRQIVWTLRNPRVSDRWKERVVPAYALLLLGWSLRVPAWLALALSPLALSAWLVAASWNEMLTLLSAPQVWLGLSVWACLYAYVRLRHHG
jgi:hypothetical protein